MLDTFQQFIRNSEMGTMYFPKVRITDIVEIIIIAFLVYQLILWIKNTKAWMLLKGLLVLGIFILAAYVFHMYTILWIAENLLPVMATAVVIIFQPELRRALERLGEKQFWSRAVMFDKKDNIRFTDETVDAIIKASFDMGAVKTGALIVVEQETVLTEYERTGIALDALVSRQILINIFEHNTPLHDGAIIVRGDRIVSATCYLPLTDNLKISKDLGTRHRAAIGMSEVSDAMIIVVSEETGHVSVAQNGQLARNITPEYLKVRMNALQKRDVEMVKIKKIWKGWKKDEGSTD